MLHLTEGSNGCLFQRCEHQKVTFQGTHGILFKENDAIVKVAHLTFIGAILVGEELCVGEDDS